MLRPNNTVIPSVHPVLSGIRHIVGCTFLLAMYWTLGAVHIQNDTMVDSVGHGAFHPLGVQSYYVWHIV
jgi:hypothetical protein